MAVILLRRKNYLSMIKNAAQGENALFRNTYALLEGEERDITKNGALSSGRLISSILYLNKLIDDLHVTAEGTQKDMLANGWHETSTLREGVVVIWEPTRSAGGNLGAHLGFYLGDDQAVSNNAETGLPEVHHYTFGTHADGKPVRRILKIYWHPILDQH